MLPDRAHVLNVCTDRYRFSVGLAAAMVRNQVSLLPPSQTREMLRQVAVRFPDVYCLTESASAEIDLPQTIYPDDRGDPARNRVANRAPDESEFAMPLIEPGRVVVSIFTSGSTGAPALHNKTWGALVAGARAESERLDAETESLAASSTVLHHCPPAAVVGTVPSQHMFGLESTILLPWQRGWPMVAERPFFPADVSALLAALPGPSMLVTTPFHLRTLLEALADQDLRMPPLKLILSATAPLSRELAIQAEARCGAPLLEIFGTTETGQLAMRRTATEPQWRTLGDAVVRQKSGVTWALGGHIDAPVALTDVLTLHSSTRFDFAGRSSDTINIAGKRTSLGFLNVQLNAIDGVIDGAFFMPDTDAAMRDGVTRLVAFVVAPQLTRRALLAALRSRIDAAFLPRPIHFVDALPRRETGKLAHADLSALHRAIESGESAPPGQRPTDPEWRNA